MRKEIICEECGFIIEMRKEDNDLIHSIDVGLKEIGENYGVEPTQAEYRQSCPMCGNILILK